MRVKRRNFPTCTLNVAKNISLITFHFCNLQYNKMPLEVDIVDMNSLFVVKMSKIILVSEMFHMSLVLQAAQHTSIFFFCKMKFDISFGPRPVGRSAMGASAPPHEPQRSA